jgi:hypothetical protein
MSTDVKLDQGPAANILLLESDVVRCTAADFVLDSPSRHTAGAGLRRALVHDFSDGLTINFGGDYPGGVTINGPTVFSSRATITLDGKGFLGKTPADLPNNLDEVHIHASVINLDTLSEDLNSAGDIKFTFQHPGEIDQDGNQRTADFPETVLLGALITTLRDEISLLKDRVARLESR